MIYELVFLESAKKEWDKLNPLVKSQFKLKLAKRLQNPHVQKDKLRDMAHCYKIKLRASEYRLIYQVINKTITVEVIAIGKRYKEEIYKIAHHRLH